MNVPLLLILILVRWKKLYELTCVCSSNFFFQQLNVPVLDVGVKQVRVQVEVAGLKSWNDSTYRQETQFSRDVVMSVCIEDHLSSKIIINTIKKYD